MLNNIIVNDYIILDFKLVLYSVKSYSADNDENGCHVFTVSEFMRPAMNA